MVEEEEETGDEAGRMLCCARDGDREWRRVEVREVEGCWGREGWMGRVSALAGLKKFDWIRT